MELEISVEDLRTRRSLHPAALSAPFCLLDIREPWESETAAIADSLSIPMGQLPDRAHLELQPDTHIVVYCHHGNRSLSAAMWLRDQGFSKAQSLAGGIEAWSQRIDPAISRY